MGDDRVAALASAYRRALVCAEAAGFRDEIDWARRVRVRDLTEQTFLRETSWCILNAGMRESVVRRLFPRIANCFWDFISSEAICSTSDTCVALALRTFNHPKKMNAIVDSAKRVVLTGGFDALRQKLMGPDALMVCRAFPYIGPVTCYHLARNIGVDCAKPDRHLVRMAKRWRFPDVWSLCASVAKAVHERVGVVDVVLWRHSAMGCDCISFG